jgi:D-glycerate 3-kinase
MPDPSEHEKMLFEIADNWLSEHSHLAVDQRANLGMTAIRLLDHLPGHSTTITGISGPPGCGKSTLARLLTALLNSMDTPALVVSLDDYYLDQDQRAALAGEIHALLLTRGVPGTHDLQRLISDLRKLKLAQTDGMKLPRFDKSTDRTMASHEWLTVNEAPQHIFLEGWCVGALPQSESDLDLPINRLESDDDTRLVWRQYVNQAVIEYQHHLAPLVDRKWYLSAPDWPSIIQWRLQQENELDQPRLKNEQDVADFLATFQRIVVHMHDHHRQWADLSLYADKHHFFRFQPDGPMPTRT